MKLSVLRQVQLAFKSGSRFAGVFSVPFGASIPLLTYANAHVLRSDIGLAEQPSAWLVAGGLLYSSLTVFGWLRQTLLSDCETGWERFAASLKALGFVVLAEGSLLHCPWPWLAVVVLGLLMAVNAIALHARFVLADQQLRPASKPRASKAAASGSRVKLAKVA